MNCIVGVSFGNSAYVLDVREEYELENVGFSLITWIKNDKSSFVSEVFKYQKFGIVTTIFDDRIIPAKIKSLEPIFNEVSITDLQKDINNNDYVYILSFKDDLLLVKTPIIPELIALDYKNENDVKEYFRINGVRYGKDF